MTFPALRARGQAATEDHLSNATIAPNADDIAIIMYTSGSTGLPKGVELTHTNFLSMVASGEAQDQVLPKKEGDTLLAYLPLAHIFELMCEMATFAFGSQVGYGHPRTLTGTMPYVRPGDTETADLPALRPTHMAAVPAVLDGIRSGLTRLMTSKDEDAWSKKLVNSMFWAALERKLHGGSWFNTGIVDGAILGKVKSAAGLDRCEVLISGGAPLAADTQDFIQAIFCPVAQGYGATETCAGATVQEIFAKSGRPADNGGGRVGAIQPATEIKLQTVDEMSYSVAEQTPEKYKRGGEILISGNNVAKGYYKNPEKTAEDFKVHKDGKVWFHTGDIGVLDPADGVLKIVDRKKDLIKLSGGEYVSLGKVEAAMKGVPGVGACVLFAQSDKDHCVVIVSQPERTWASVGGKPEEAALLKAIQDHLRKSNCVKFEIPTKLKIDDTIWTPESGLLTAALKLQRNPLRDFYNKPGGLLSEMSYNFN
jgi:long-chain acyl-CoA synthetase